MYTQHNAGLETLAKLWTRISVQPLSRAELRQVICAKHAQLETVVDRLLDVYLLLSAGGHVMPEGNEASESDAGRFLGRDGRLISTR